MKIIKNIIQQQSHLIILHFLIFFLIKNVYPPQKRQKQELIY